MHAAGFVGFDVYDGVFAMSSGYVSMCGGECRTHVYIGNDRDEFFKEVAHEISFGDCTDTEVIVIKWCGKYYRYTGWEPQEVFTFRTEDGDELTYMFPEFEH